MQIFSHLKNKRRFSLFGCIFFSVFVHCIAVLLLQQYSTWFYSSAHYARSIAGEFQEKEFSGQDYDEVLRTTFQKLSKDQNAKNSLAYSFAPDTESLQGVDLYDEDLAVHTPTVDNYELEQPSMDSFLDLFQGEHLIIGRVNKPGIGLNSQIDTWPHQEIYRGLKDAISDFDLARNRPEISAEQIYQFSELAEEIEEALLIDRPKLQISWSEPETATTLITSLQEEITKPQVIALREAQESVAEKQVLETALPQLPSLSQLSTRSCSEGFDVDVIVTPKKDGKGYLFALTLIQNPSLRFDPIPQNFYFLIDRANSIQAKRLHSTCHAVIRSLSCLPRQDRFNVLAFDNKIQRLSAVQEKVKSQSIRKAKKFLMNMQLASFFTSANFQKPISTLLFENLAADQAHSLIILTNGENITSKMKDLFFISNWTDRNQGFSVHSLVIDGDSNLPYLNLFCEMNQGKLHKASNKKGLKRKLIKIVQSISNPIATNVSCTAISTAPNASIKLLPDGKRVSHIYDQQPFVILGSTETLDDFVLFIQGKHKDQWLNIKKTISFKNAKKAGTGLKQQWALEQTYDCFDQFTQDGNPLHLIEADNILAPFNIESVFNVGK